MDDVDTTHGPSSIVKEPILRLADIFRNLCAQLSHNVMHNRARVVAASRDAPLDQIVQLLRIEYVERFEVLLNIVNQRRDQPDEQADEGEQTRHGRNKVAAKGRLLGEVFLFSDERRERLENGQLK